MPESEKKRMFSLTAAIGGRPVICGAWGRSGQHCGKVFHNGLAATARQVDDNALPQRARRRARYDRVGCLARLAASMACVKARQGRIRSRAAVILRRYVARQPVPPVVRIMSKTRTQGKFCKQGPQLGRFVGQQKS